MGRTDKREEEECMQGRPERLIEDNRWRGSEGEEVILGGKESERDNDKYIRREGREKTVGGGRE